MLFEEFVDSLVFDLIAFIRASSFDKIIKRLSLDHEHKIVFQICEKLVLDDIQI